MDLISEAIRDVEQTKPDYCVSGGTNTGEPWERSKQEYWVWQEWKSSVPRP